MGSEHDTLGPPKVVKEDLRRLARRRLPQPVFDYLDGGAEDEITLRENTRALQDISFRPRGAIAIKKCDLAVRVLGQELSSPAILAPVGYSRLMHPGAKSQQPKLLERQVPHTSLNGLPKIPAWSIPARGRAFAARWWNSSGP